MYPKLKVRSLDQDVRFVGGTDPSLPGLKALFLPDFSSPAKEESKPTTKKSEVPSSLNLGSITPLSVTKDNRDKGGEEDMNHIKPHIRASSIPRPRAVLSSPDNDDMIGSKTKRTEERASRLKPRQLGQKCDATTKHSSVGRPKAGRQVSEEVTNKSDIHKPHRLGMKSHITLKPSAAERLKNGREAPEENANKSNKISDWVM